MTDHVDRLAIHAKALQAALDAATKVADQHYSPHPWPPGIADDLDRLAARYDELTFAHRRAADAAGVDA